MEEETKRLGVLRAICARRMQIGTTAARTDSLLMRPSG